MNKQVKIIFKALTVIVSILTILLCWITFVMYHIAKYESDHSILNFDRRYEL